jgi:hypothetical protein
VPREENTEAQDEIIVRQHDIREQMSGVWRSVHEKQIAKHIAGDPTEKMQQDIHQRMQKVFGGKSRLGKRHRLFPEDHYEPNLTPAEKQSALLAMSPDSASKSTERQRAMQVKADITNGGRSTDDWDASVKRGSPIFPTTPEPEPGSPAHMKKLQQAANGESGPPEEMIDLY